MESVFAVTRAVGASQFPHPRVSLQLPTPLKLISAVHQLPFHFRYNKSVLNLNTRETWRPVFASKSNLQDGDSLEDKSDSGKSSDVPQGPPLLTILAGFLVLILVFWVLGSIFSWLISFFVNSSPPT